MKCTQQCTNLSLQSEGLLGELGDSDLLGDTTGLTFLHIGVTDLVQQGGLSGIHVTCR